MQTKESNINLSNLEHVFIDCEKKDKMETLGNQIRNLIRNPEQDFFLIFCNSVKATRAVDYLVNELNVRCLSLHGELPTQMRIENF